jgi:hypothetical protein
MIRDYLFRARERTARYSGERWGVPIGLVGPAVVNDPAGRSQHEIDVLALAQGARRYDEGARIVVVGEAKSSNRRRDVRDLARLESIRDLLVRRGHDAADAHLARFSREGFDDALVQAAGRREDVDLVDLVELYG